MKVLIAFFAQMIYTIGRSSINQPGRLDTEFKVLNIDNREQKMDRKEIVLAGLAPAKGAPHSPVQVQKLFFLIDKNISDLIDGPYFSFEPYNYGPFDSQVYFVLEELEDEGLVKITYDSTWRKYMLTKRGQELGDELLESLPEKARDFIERASQFVREHSFTQLVSAIYKAYPEMRANSVFQS
jgi:hypothetical protein